MKSSIWCFTQRKNPSVLTWPQLSWPFAVTMTTAAIGRQRQSPLLGRWSLTNDEAVIDFRVLWANQDHHIGEAEMRGNNYVNDDEKTEEYKTDE